MLAINEILQWASDNGYANMYGNPAHINRMMHGTDFSASAEQTAVYCYLITAAETIEARDRVTVGVFFARLCDFDFDPKGLLTVQMALMDTAKRMLADLTAGNVIGYDDPVRWQFGYDDFAENVAWVCARVTFMDLAADCVPLPVPPAIIELPKAAESLLNILGVDNITSTKWAAHGTKDGSIRIRIALVCLKNINADDTVPMEVYLNGVELSTGYDYSVISQSMADIRPELQPYIGFWLVEYNAVTDYSETFTMTAKLGDWWDGGTIEWQQ